MTAVNQYTIESLMDITDIPEDRIDAFLAEFKEWLLHTKVMRKTAEEIHDALGVGDLNIKAILTPSMIWTDDNRPGITEASITIQTEVETHDKQD